MLREISLIKSAGWNGLREERQEAQEFCEGEKELKEKVQQKQGSMKRKLKVADVKSSGEEEVEEKKKQEKGDEKKEEKRRKKADQAKGSAKRKDDKIYKDQTSDLE
eukprot:s242_g11.t1